jgi:hypothetical protein
VPSSNRGLEGSRVLGASCLEALEYLFADQALPDRNRKRERKTFGLDVVDWFSLKNTDDGCL